MDGEAKQPTKTDERKRRMLEALEASAGIVSEASKAANVSRRTHYEWLQNDEKYREAVRDIDNLALDKAEKTLFNAIDSGDLTATIFYLKTKGKKRGYTEKIDYDAIVKETEARILKAENEIEEENSALRWKF